MKTTGVILMLFLMFVFGGCERGASLDLPDPPAGFLHEKENINQGKKLFMAHCAECHGSLAEGRTQRAARFQPPAPDFHELSYRKVAPGYLYRRIERGRLIEPFGSRGSVMPPWGNYLSEREIWTLVAYLIYRNDVSTGG